MKKRLDPLKTTQVVLYSFFTFFYLGATTATITMVVFLPYIFIVGFLYGGGANAPENLMYIPIVIICLLELLAIYLYIKIIKKLRIKNLTNAYLTDKAIITKCYDAFVECQKAWIHNDNEKLKKLVSQDVFDGYQKPTLEEKNENRKHHFKLRDAKIISHYGTSEDAYEIINMQMKITDYFEDRHADVEPLLGKPVHIFLKKYYLEFIIYHGDTTNCPNCGAPLPKGQTVCEYCKAPVEMIDGKIIMTKRQMVI